MVPRKQEYTLCHPRQITDAYLLSLAIANKGKPVSFDGGITTLVPEKHRGNVVIMESQAACSDSL